MASESESVVSELSEQEQKLYAVLDGIGIHHTTLYHKVVTTMDEGKEIMKQLEGNVLVNLLLKDNTGQLYLVIKMMTTKLNFKDLATKTLKVKSTNMPPKEVMTSKLAVPVGCATVFALCNDASHEIKVLIDNNIPKDQKVNFHPMRNDATTTISYDDMIKYINHLNKEIIYF